MKIDEYVRSWPPTNTGGPRSEDLGQPSILTVLKLLHDPLDQ